MIDPDFKEAIMGHVLEGSRENYFSRYRPQDIEESYQKIDFSREISKSETEKLKSQLREEREKILALEKSITHTQEMFKRVMTAVSGEETELRLENVEQEGETKARLTFGLPEKALNKLRKRASSDQQKEENETNAEPQYTDAVKVRKHDIDTIVDLIKKGYEKTFENEKYVVFKK